MNNITSIINIPSISNIHSITNILNNNLFLCSTYKSKNNNSQCPNKRKDNLLFCGKHKNIKDIVFNSNSNTNIINENNVNNVNNNSNSNNNNLLNIINNETIIENKIIKKNKNLGSKRKVLKNLEKHNYYNDYLNTRKTYIKENTKHIELIDYIENSKLDTYPLPRINASLEYYKIIKTYEHSQFLQAINNIEKLNSFFIMLLKANQNMNKIIKLQRFIKKSLIYHKLKLYGPAINNRNVCVNDSDFFTLDELKDIPNDEFFSFKDEKNFIYGFHIDSITQLVFKSDEHYFEQFKKKIKNKQIIINNNSINLCYQQFIKLLCNHYNKIKVLNPYTRFLIDNNTKLNIITLYAKKEYDVKKIINTSNDIVPIDIKLLVKNKCLEIFQKMDLYGYHTDINWLYNQNTTILKIFYKKLALLWNFEFGLTHESRYKIAQTHHIFNNLHDIMTSRFDKYNLLDKILEPVNSMVSNGETEPDRQNGCIIILYALAFINNRCVLANPWLA